MAPASFCAATLTGYSRRPRLSGCNMIRQSPNLDRCLTSYAHTAKHLSVRPCGISMTDLRFGCGKAPMLQKNHKEQSNEVESQEYWQAHATHCSRGLPTHRASEGVD